MLVNGNVKVTIPMPFRNCSEWKRIVTPDGEQKFADPLITNLARAYRWQSLIDEQVQSPGESFSGKIIQDRCCLEYFDEAERYAAAFYFQE